MATAVTVRVDFSADELRRLAAASKHANQSRRLLSLAAVVDGMSRADAARIGGMDRQTLRDWVHRFNERGPEGLKDSWSKGHRPRLSAEQLAQLAEVVETGPERQIGRCGTGCTASMNGAQKGSRTAGRKATGRASRRSSWRSSPRSLKPARSVRSDAAGLGAPLQ